MLLEAVPAIYRSALGRLERNFSLLSAVSASRLVHFAGTSVGSKSTVSESHLIHSCKKVWKASI